jgi:hypothetical protein
MPLLLLFNDNWQAAEPTRPRFSAVSIPNTILGTQIVFTVFTSTVRNSRESIFLLLLAAPALA